VPDPTTATTPAVAAPALAPVASLGLVLAGCPACRMPLGVHGAPGLAEALAAHSRCCPKQRPAAPAPVPARPADDVCPGCGCEAELYLRASGWRCGDCLAELLLTDPATPAGRSRTRQPVHDLAASPPVVVIARRRRQHQRRRPAQQAVVA
jgi:hypothetical protein